ncbi:MAG: CotH kinase family protein [Prolixibacteraceae bacterium]|nr:CotH kinase family protein [Prolixibacteraceae bacterium]
MKFLLPILFLSFTALFSAGQSFRINELMSSNGGVLKDNDGDTPDWIEFYNAGTVSVSLKGYGLSDKKAQPFQWIFPDFQLVPGGYLVVFASGKNRVASLVQLHTNFKLDADGESVYMTKPSGELADSVRIGALSLNTSYGRSLKSSTVWTIFATATPGKENSGTEFPTEKPGLPVFYLPGGVYSSSQKLKLTPPSTKDTIYYTLDGSVPTRISYMYTGEINIGASKVVRARILKAGQLPGETVTNSYLITSNKKIPIVSISMNPEDLWDYNTGIYVKGPYAKSENPFFGANFWMDWEKACHFELFETTGNKMIDVDAGTKIYGNWSRANAQKSMAFYCRKSYGYEEFKYKIFKERPFDEFKDLVLRNSGNDWNNTMFRDGLMTGLTLGLNLEQQAFRPTAIYLNGEYWGILNIREKINEHMIAAHQDVDADNVTILEGNGTVVTGNSTDYWTMVNFLGNNSLATQANYNKMLEWIDVNSFIDYFSSQIYFRNHDWPGNNIKYWKTNDSGGHWRWILFDTDFGMGIWGSVPSENTLELATATNGPDWPNPPWSTLMLRRLLENTSFRNQFVNRFADLLNSRFLAERVNQAIDRKKDLISDEIGNHLLKWNGGTLGGWQWNVSTMKSFATSRPANVFNHIRMKFNFQAPQTVTARADSTQGSIQLNSLKLTNLPWKGTYFPDVPITLTAIPQAGYRFVKWTGITTGSTSATVTLAPKAGLDLTAVFENDGSHYEDVVINEISFNNDATKNPGDWIELYNKGKYDIDISGWKLTDSDPNHQFVFAANTVLKANGYLVIASDLTKIKAIFGSVKNLLEPFTFNFALANTIDAVKLYSRDVQLIDEVNYANDEPWQTFSLDELWSLELINPTANNNSGKNWVLSEKDGTPGMHNTPFTPDAIIDLQAVSATPAVAQNYPNPFSQGTYIEFKLAKPAKYQISILDVNGRMMQIMEDKNPISSVHTLYWDGKDQSGKPVPSGVYFYRLECDGFSEIKRMVKM